MSNFEVTYRDGSEVKRVVLTASDESAAGKAFSSTHQGISADNVISVKNLDSYNSKYGAANFVGALISFVGWAALVLGVIGVIAGVLTTHYLIGGMQGFDTAMRPMFIAAALGVSGFSLMFALIGLLMAAAGQHLRATTDTANSLGEILVLMKSRYSKP